MLLKDVSTKTHTHTCVGALLNRCWCCEEEDDDKASYSMMGQ